MYLERPMIESFLLSGNDSAKFIGISHGLFNQLRRQPDFPKAVVISQRCIRWRRDELAAYVEKRETVGMQPEPPQFLRDSKNK